jgi:hypothetical protein
VPAIAEACVPDPDERLRELLVAVIDDCTAICGRERTAVAEPVERAAI